MRRPNQVRRTPPDRTPVPRRRPRLPSSGFRRRRVVGAKGALGPPSPRRQARPSRVPPRRDLRGRTRRTDRPLPNRRRSKEAPQTLLRDWRRSSRWPTRPLTPRRPKQTWTSPRCHPGLTWPHWPRRAFPRGEESSGPPCAASDVYAQGQLMKRLTRQRRSRSRPQSKVLARSSRPPKLSSRPRLPLSRLLICGGLQHRPKPRSSNPGHRPRTSQPPPFPARSSPRPRHGPPSTGRGAGASGCPRSVPRRLSRRRQSSFLPRKRRRRPSRSSSLTLRRSSTFARLLPPRPEPRSSNRQPYRRAIGPLSNRRVRPQWRRQTRTSQPPPFPAQSSPLSRNQPPPSGRGVGASGCPRSVPRRLSRRRQSSFLPRKRRRRPSRSSSLTRQRSLTSAKHLPPRPEPRSSNRQPYRRAIGPLSNRRVRPQRRRQTRTSPNQS